jgi:hypothetical protein
VTNRKGNSFANGPKTGKPRELAASETTFWLFVEGDDPKLLAS